MEGSDNEPDSPKMPVLSELKQSPMRGSLSPLPHSEGTALADMALSEDPALVADLCLQPDGMVIVPDAIRVQVWHTLLGIKPSADDMDLAESIVASPKDLPNQRVIRMDALRTRAEVEWFRKETTQERIVDVLTHWCKARDVPYKQGLNEVLAPVLALRVNNVTAFHLLSAIVDRFLPAVYGTDADFIGLQCSFVMFRLLMLYHDPALCSFLDQYSVPPELYATPWLVTLFARSLPTDCVLPLWDFMFVYNHPGVVHCLLLALVMGAKDVIMETPVAELPGIVSAITLTTPAEVQTVCRQALSLYESTPSSVLTTVLETCFSNTVPPSRLPELESRVCAEIGVYELMAGIGRTRLDSSALAPQHAPSSPSASGGGGSTPTATDSDTAPRYFVVDCRPQEEFDAGHLPTAFHLDPELLLKPEALASTMEGFLQMKGIHLTIMGNGFKPADLGLDDDGMPDVVGLAVSYFLQRQFHFVSEVAGGFRAVHDAHLDSLPTAFIGHDAARCIPCLQAEAAGRRTSLRSLGLRMAASTRAVASAAAGRLGVSSTTVRQRVNGLRGGFRRWLQRSVDTASAFEDDASTVSSNASPQRREAPPMDEPFVVLEGVSEEGVAGVEGEDQDSWPPPFSWEDGGVLGDDDYIDMALDELERRSTMVKAEPRVVADVPPVEAVEPPKPQEDTRRRSSGGGWLKRWKSSRRSTAEASEEGAPAAPPKTKALAQKLMGWVGRARAGSGSSTKMVPVSSSAWVPPSDLEPQEEAPFGEEGDKSGEGNGEEADTPLAPPADKEEHA